MSTILTEAEVLAFLKIASTVIDQDSSSGQPILYTRSTINFVVGDEIIIGRGTIREEIKTILSIQSGISLTTSVNLEFIHTELQADTVEAEYQDAEIISDMNLGIDNLIKNHCSRCFNQVIGTIEYLDGDGGVELWLEDYPVANVVLYIDADLDREFGDEDLIDEDDYVVYPDIGLIYYGASFPIGRRNVRATYDKGFDDDDIPYDLKLACKTEIKIQYSKYKEDSQGLSSYAVAGMSKKFYSSELSPFTLAILNKNYVKRRA